MQISEPREQAVRCPICGGAAKVRYVVREDTGLQVVGFFCAGQARTNHGIPTYPELVRSVAESVSVDP